MSFKKPPKNMRALKRGILGRMKEGEDINQMLAPYPREMQVEIVTWIKRKLDG